MQKIDFQRPDVFKRIAGNSHRTYVAKNDGLMLLDYVQHLENSVNLILSILHDREARERALTEELADYARL